MWGRDNTLLSEVSSEKVLTGGLSSCLLGIFEVNMSLIYGEGGKKAFLRLQREIMDQSDDHSLFAWRQDPGPDAPLEHGLLAPSPKQFIESSRLIGIPYFEPRSAYAMTNRGLEIRLAHTCTLDGEDHFVTLGCAEPQEDLQAKKAEEIEKKGDGEPKTEVTNNAHQIGFYVALLEGNRCVRIRLDHLVRIESPRSDYKPATLEKICFPQSIKEKPTRKHYIFQMVEPQLPNKKSIFQGLLLFFQRGQPFISTSKAKSVGFALAGSTTPGRKEATLAFGLERGGTAGVFFRPSKRYVGRRPITNPAKILDYIVVIFGVNLDGSIYADISGILQPEYYNIIDEWDKEHTSSGADNTKETKTIVSRLSGADRRFYLSNDVKRMKWVEKYVKEHSTNYLSGRAEKKIWDLMFSVEIQGQGRDVDGNLVYNVGMSYHSI
jgi:hypothetical protein